MHLLKIEIEIADIFLCLFSTDEILILAFHFQSLEWIVWIEDEFGVIVDVVAATDVAAAAAVVCYTSIDQFSSASFTRQLYKNP